MTSETFSKRIAAMKFRAWHRGTREADFMIGGFFDKHHKSWGESQAKWFEALIDEEDVDIMAWALGTQPSPPIYEGPMMVAFKKLDYVTI